MSESTTPSDKEVPGAQPPWAPGNRARGVERRIKDRDLTCSKCDVKGPMWFTPSYDPDLFLCRPCYEGRYGPIVDV